MGQFKNLDIEIKTEGIFKNVNLETVDIFALKAFHDVKNAMAGICILKNTCELLYLDYVNNFLSVERFALYYGLSTNQAKNILSMGKKQNWNLDLRARLKPIKKKRKIFSNIPKATKRKVK
jgi:hypothetical protein